MSIVKDIKTLIFCIGALLFLEACAPASGVTSAERYMTPVKMPFVRALLNDTDKEATIGGNGSIAIECLRDKERFIYYSPGTVRVQSKARTLRLLNSSGEEVESDLDQVTISSRNKRQLLWYNGRPYRGIVRIHGGSTAIVLVNILFVEDYLRGVVPPEIGPITDIDAEAIKAQAVAARTYTMSHFGQYGNKPYDVKSDVSDQVYEGALSEKDVISRAISETVGQVAKSEGDFISAYYHSTCGGYTSNIELSWERDPMPYLVSVSCRGMCVPSKYYNWSETYSEAQLAKRISNYETNLRGRTIRYSRIDSIYIDNGNLEIEGLRNQRLVVIADGVTLSYSRDRIRWVITRASNGSRILQSDFFDLTDALWRKSGGLKSITLSGHGYGHGVGMCQMGALGMARSDMGFSYRDILHRYYTGITIDRLY